MGIVMSIERPPRDKKASRDHFGNARYADNVRPLHRDKAPLPKPPPREGEFPSISRHQEAAGLQADDAPRQEANDVLLLLAGISPNVMIWIGPFTIFHSSFVHANLNWTLGPLKYVIATPVFHRWHHTALDRGGDTNFAGTFPIWDILFGTFRMPANELPDDYGAGDPSMPSGFGGQLVHPFRQ